MFTYRNKRTGVEITTPCPVSGEWELVEPKVTAEEPKEEPKPKKKRTVKK